MKNITITLVFIIVSNLNSFGQSSLLKQIENKKFDKAEKELVKDLLKSPGDIVSNYCMAVLLINREYTGYNPEKSYEFLNKADSRLRDETDEKVIRNLNKIPVSQIEMTNLLDTITNAALEDAMKTNELSGYKNFLRYYTTAPEKYKNLAVEKRDAAAFKIAAEVNSVESYQKFITEYPSAKQTNEAVQKRNSLAFGKVKEDDKIENYRNFISAYPAASEVNMAWERIHELAYDGVKIVNTSASYENFIKEYPKSKQFKEAFSMFEQKQFSENTLPGNWESYRKFINTHPLNSWKSAAEDSILEIAKRLDDWRIMDYCAESFSGLKKKTASLLLHDFITNDGEKITLDKFYREYGNNISDEIKDKDYEIAEIGDGLELHKDFDPENSEKYDEYIRLAAPGEKAFVALQRMISEDITAKRWKLALDKVNKFTVYFGEKNEKITDLVEIIAKQWDNSIQIHSVGSGINSSKGSEYVPVISADDKSLYFCGRERDDNVGGEDIFVSKKTNNIWGSSKIISDLSSGYTNDAPLNVSSDGTSILLFKSGNLFYSNKTKDGWDEPVEYPEEINAGDWQADAMISSDGKALIFASTMEGGYNFFDKYEDYFHGDGQYASDIYVSLLDEDNEWGNPINIGNVINTPFCDRMPFLHPDMKTLFFSSDGHGGLGKLDVFKSVRLADSCWNCWSEPINLGKEINTAESDWGYKISTDGDKAYFSKTNTTNNSYDIFWLNIPAHLRPELVATISGKLLDNNKQPVSAEIRWEDLESGKNVGRSKSDPTDGSYFIVLPMGKMYGYFVDEENFFPISDNLDLRKEKKPLKIEKTIVLTSYKQMVDDQTAVTINNLFFNFAESTLLPYSIPELKRVAKIIRASHSKVEISGHADNIGDDANNQVLSERRAKAVKDFLIKEGCPVSDLNSVGYGETRPVATNDTDAGRAQNRRVEMKFIK
jgi:outer membrane protein OmpA-like peptidoglycan-associated protein